MTNREINEAVAKKLGWEHCIQAGAHGWHKSLTPGGYHFHERIPSYTTSIADAWEIVKLLHEKELVFNLLGSKFGWTFGISKQTPNNPYMESLGIAYFQKTPEMAICLSFLDMEAK